MVWHKNHIPQEGVVTYASEVEAWKHFDKFHASFAAQPHMYALVLLRMVSHRTQMQLDHTLYGLL